MTRGLVSLSCATISYHSCFFLNLNGIKNSNNQRKNYGDIQIIGSEKFWEHGLVGLKRRQDLFTSTNDEINVNPKTSFSVNTNVNMRIS